MIATNTCTFCRLECYCYWLYYDCVYRTCSNRLQANDYSTWPFYDWQMKAINYFSALTYCRTVLGEDGGFFVTVNLS